MEIFDAFAHGIAQIIIALISLGIFISYILKAERLEREAIEKNFAFYDQKTIKFTWKDYDDFTARHNKRYERRKPKATEFQPIIYWSFYDPISFDLDSAKRHHSV